MKSLKNTIFILLAVSVISLWLFSGCDVQNNATGFEDMIYVVADSSEFLEIQNELQQVFGKVIYTPQEENLFRLQRVSVNNLFFVQDKKNVIILAPLNSGSRTSQYINSIVDSTVKEYVSINQEFQFNKRDLWARNQLVMILTSPTMEQLKSNILLDADNLLYQFQEASNERLLQGLYNASFEQPAVEGKMLKDYGWIIYVQTDFVVAKDSPDDNFVWFRSPPGKDMERWIFVSWVENATPDMLDSAYIFENRNRLTNKFYRTTDDSDYVLIFKKYTKNDTASMEIAFDYMTTKEVNFNGKYAIMTQGLWTMTDRTMGGPFINYTFYDEKTQRLYMIDASLFAPKYRKKSLLQQLDVVLQSFKTETELSESRKKDLLSYVEE